MNSDKRLPSRPHQKARAGNVVVYVLIALALIALLTATLSRQEQDTSENIDADRLALLTTEMLTYTGAAKNVVDQMLMAGTNPADLQFVRPNQPSFDNAPYYNMVYHPEGGGLSLPAPDAAAFTHTGTNPDAGWYLGMFSNVEWTPSTADDVILAAYGLSEPLCAAINKKLTGSPVIPELDTAGNPAQFFVDDEVSGIANNDFMISDCGDCEGYPALCVASSDGSIRTYYNIISAQ